MENMLENMMDAEYKKADIASLKLLDFSIELEPHYFGAEQIPSSRVQHNRMRAKEFFQGIFFLSFYPQNNTFSPALGYFSPAKKNGW